ncbi:YgjV family protein [Allohahella marinimesophila]|uniref:YgjV family protein n=1 Tax=Allohahella marinimesophila TaxID=1054972 RepID=A0ABP7NHQ3_9GAMM
MVGGLAALVGITAFQLRSENRMMYCLAAAAGLWALHFLLLGAVTAALMNAITLVRNLLAVRGNMRSLGYVFITAYLISGGLTWESAWDVLPTIAVCSGSSAVFLLSGLWRRGGLLLGGLLWLVFNIHAGSIPGIVVMAAESISNTVFIIRALRLRAKGSRPSASDQ